MARQWRIEYPGAIYHVLSRGNGRQDIFLDDDDRFAFLDLLQSLADRYEIEVYAYVLMGNHYHLLLKTQEPNLSRGMQWLGTAYTRGFHLRHHTSGHLFQGRFKSFLVENCAYLLQLSLYIHRNPIRAKIVPRLADYAWSSYRYYAYKKKAPKWLDTGLILGQFTAENRRAAYRRKIQRYAHEEKRIWEEVTYGLAYGSQAFIADLKKRFLKALFCCVRMHRATSGLMRARALCGMAFHRQFVLPSRQGKSLLVFFLWIDVSGIPCLKVWMCALLPRWPIFWACCLKKRSSRWQCVSASVWPPLGKLLLALRIMPRI